MDCIAWARLTGADVVRDGFVETFAERCGDGSSLVRWLCGALEIPFRAYPGLGFRERGPSAYLSAGATPSGSSSTPIPVSPSIPRGVEKSPEDHDDRQGQRDQSQRPPDELSIALRFLLGAGVG